MASWTAVAEAAEAGDTAFPESTRVLPPPVRLPAGSHAKLKRNSRKKLGLTVAWRFPMLALKKAASAKIRLEIALYREIRAE